MPRTPTTAHRWDMRMARTVGHIGDRPFGTIQITSAGVCRTARGIGDGLTLHTAGAIEAIIAAEVEEGSAAGAAFVEVSMEEAMAGIANPMPLIPPRPFALVVCRTPVLFASAEQSQPPTGPPPARS
jgi:hypothetical protein